MLKTSISSRQQQDTTDIKRVRNKEGVSRNRLGGVGKCRKG